VCALPVLTTIRRTEYAELIGLFFLIGAALGMWFVPLSTVLERHGFAHIRPYAFAVAGVAAFVSPLLFGAVADRHASPVKVLRWLALATAGSMALASAAIQNELSSWAVLALIQLHAFCSAPTWSIASTIVFARLENAKKEFGPIRAMATLGWMAGCLAVSAVGADDSTLAGLGGALVWLVVSGMTFWLPALATPKSVANLTWSQRMGYDALSLLKNRDHRVVFLTVALFTIPLAAFYPYSPLNLRALGFSHPVAWMSLGQITEVIAMLALGALMLRFRLKWIIVGGLAIGVVRFGLAATDSPWGILAAIALHGASFTLVSITAQIYIDERVDPAWRARAQALMSLLNGGIGNMIGYLGSGAWFVACSAGGTTRWPMFWSGLSATMAAVLIFFLLMYRGRGARDLRVV
jgi:MFS family permease